MLGNKQSQMDKLLLRSPLISSSGFIQSYCSEGKFKEKLSRTFISYPSDIESIVWRIDNWGCCDEFIILESSIMFCTFTFV